MLVSHEDGMPTPFSIVLETTFDNHTGETFDLCFSPDGTVLLSSDGKAVHIWKLELPTTWKFQKRIPCFAVCPRIAPDGKMFVYRDQEQMLHLCSLEGEEIVTLPYFYQTNVDCAFSPDQRWLISGNTHGQLIIWDLSTYQLHSTDLQLHFHAPWLKAQWTSSFLHQITESSSSANRFQFTPDGQRFIFVAANDEGYVHIYHFEPDKQHIVQQKVLAHKGIEDQKISSDGKLLAITSRDTVYIYDLETFQQLTQFEGTGDAGYTLLAFSPDSQFLASSTFEGNVDIWSMATFEHITSFAAHPGLITQWGPVIGGLDWSATGYIATGGTSLYQHDINKHDYTIKLWKVVKRV